jgi:hypothetical protein
MKLKTSIFLFALLVLYGFNAIAQDNRLDFSVGILHFMDREYFSNQNNEVGVIQSENQFVENNNLIQVTQIGFYNRSNVEIISENYRFQVEQTGNNNYLNVYKNTNVLNQSFVQTGNNNSISDFSFYAGNQINMSIQQEGNNLSIFNNGSNSISKDLKINQTGNSGTIFIFNH